MILDILKGRRHVMYGGNASLFLHDVSRRRELEFGIERRDSDAVESSLFEPLDVFRAKLHTLR